MQYRQNISRSLDAVSATGPAAGQAFESALAAAAPALDRIRDWYETETLPLLRLPERRDDLNALTGIADRLRDRCRDIIVLGTGGSSLGGKCLNALADAGWGPPDGTPRLHFMDNVDPHGFESLFAAVAPETTGIIVISKSGGTAETLAQLNICLQWLGTDGSADRVVAITEPGERPLRTIAETAGFTLLDHDPGLGGRFSVLSLIGMLPAMIAGLDVAAIRAGAAETLQQTLGAKTPTDSAPATGAALSVALANTCGHNIAALLLYSDRLVWFGQWYRQLWAESLGKEGKGTTPVPFIGTVDQHSQLQLYLDGPKDKFFTVIEQKDAGTGRTVDPAATGGVDLGPLAGRTMGDLLEVSRRGTVDTIASHGMPVRALTIDAVNEATMGALMMHFMLETIVAAHLLGIDPFDQPAVEHGKVLARRYLTEMAK